MGMPDPAPFPELDCEVLMYREQPEIAGLLCKRPQHKFSLKHAWVGDFKPLMGDDSIIMEQDIKIDIARPFVDDLFPTEVILDTLERIQKRKRLKCGFHLVIIS
jgi:hypothetical protein